MCGGKKEPTTIMGSLTLVLDLVPVPRNPNTLTPVTQNFREVPQVWNSVIMNISCFRPVGTDVPVGLSQYLSGT